MAIYRMLLIALVAGFAGVGAVAMVPHSAQAASFQEERAAKLDSLFAQLNQAFDSNEAEAITSQIWTAWLQSGDPEIDEGMQNAVIAMNRRRFDAAIAMLDVLIEKAPGYAEAWNKRATVYYLMNRFDASLADIERTLALEPRHFGALSGRALVFTEQGRRAEALRAIEEALQVNPFLKGAKAIIERNGGTYEPRRGI